MDATQLAKDLASFLTPFLPYLIKPLTEAAKKSAEKLGEEAWSKAQTLWNKLQSKIETKPTLKEAAQEVAKAPDDKDAQAAFRLQLKKMLQEDPDLLSELQPIVSQSSRIINTGGGAYIEGNVHVRNGDFVIGNKNTTSRKKK